MATISKLLEMSIINIHDNNKGSVPYALGLAQIDQAKKLLDKGYDINTELDNILGLMENEDCKLDISKFM